MDHQNITVFVEYLKKIQKKKQFSLNLYKNDNDFFQCPCIKKNINLDKKDSISISLKTNKLKKLNDLKQKAKLINCSNIEKESFFGKGNLNADIFIYKETNFFNEKNEINLLIKIINSMGLDISELFVISLNKNILQSSKLTHDEFKSKKDILSYFLKTQISIIKPQIIIDIGYNVITNNIFNINSKKVVFYKEIPVINTLSLNDLLLKNTLQVKRLFWEDMLYAMDKVQLFISKKQKLFFT